jgi:hypothetical protein
MKPLRFPGRTKWWIVAVLAMFSGLPAVPLAVWFAWTMPTLQQFYLIAYLDCTETRIQPSATTKVQWLFKTAPGRERVLVTAPDVVSASGGELPVRLSQYAIETAGVG